MTNNYIGPTTYYTETDQKMVYPSGGGGRAIVVIAQDAALTIGTVYEFNNVSQAQATLTVGSVLYNTIVGSSNGSTMGIFNEGAQYSQDQTLGVDTVYALSIPNSPQLNDYTAAMTLADALPVRIEVFPGLSNSIILSSIATHLSSLADVCDVRVGVVTVPDNVITDMVSEVAGITSDRLFPVDDPTMVGVIAAKLSYTPYNQDPSQGAYRSNPTIITRLKSDMETLMGNGICCSYNGYNGPEPYAIVSPAFQISGSPAGRDPNGFAFARLNMDEHILNIYAKTQKYIKGVNTQVARNLLEADIQGYLDAELSKPTIEDYTIEVDLAGPYSITVNGSIRVMGAIYNIAINMNMVAPTGIVNTPTGGD